MTHESDYQGPFLKILHHTARPMSALLTSLTCVQTCKLFRCLESYRNVDSWLQRQPHVALQLQVDAGEADDGLPDHPLPSHPLTAVKPQSHTHTVYIFCNQRTSSALSCHCQQICLLSVRTLCCVF